MGASVKTFISIHPSAL